MQAERQELLQRAVESKNLGLWSSARRKLKLREFNLRKELTRLDFELVDLKQYERKVALELYSQAMLGNFSWSDRIGQWKDICDRLKRYHQQGELSPHGVAELMMRAGKSMLSGKGIISDEKLSRWMKASKRIPTIPTTTLIKSSAVT